MARYFAVTNTAPATNYADAKLLSVGELTPGRWNITVTINAEHFTQNYLFRFEYRKGRAKVRPDRSSSTVRHFVSFPKGRTFDGWTEFGLLER